MQAAGDVDRGFAGCRRFRRWNVQAAGDLERGMCRLQVI